MKKLIIPSIILLIAALSFIAVNHFNNDSKKDPNTKIENSVPSNNAVSTPASTIPTMNNAITQQPVATTTPTVAPTDATIISPIVVPTGGPNVVTTTSPAITTTIAPTTDATKTPTKAPTTKATTKPTVKPTSKPTKKPTVTATKKPANGDDPFTVYLGKGGYTKPSVYGPYLNAEQLQVVKKHQQEFKKKYIKDSMSDYEKVRIIHDYLAENVVYRHWEYDYANTAYGVFEYGGGACSGFARAFKALCDVCDVPCYYVHSEEDDHQWNYVKIDGKWYEMDLTWSVGCGSDAGFLQGGVCTIKGGPTISKTPYLSSEDYMKVIKSTTEQYLKSNKLEFTYDDTSNKYKYEFTDYIDFNTIYKGDLGLRQIDAKVKELISEVTSYIKANPCASNQKYVVNVYLDSLEASDRLHYFKIGFSLFLYDTEGYFLDKQIIEKNMLQGVKEASTANFILEPKLGEEYNQYVNGTAPDGTYYYYYRYKKFELSGDYDAVLKALRNASGDYFKGYDDSVSFYIYPYINDAYVYNGELYLDIALLEKLVLDDTYDTLPDVLPE